jgi:micrococcal nuclease
MTLFGGPLKTSFLFNYIVEIEKVIDGDTLDLRIDLGFKIYTRQRIRLYGIDTKEIFGPKKEPAGKLSKTFTTKWVDEATQPFRMSARKYDWREKYGRLLGVIYRGDDPVSLNDALLEAGLAKPSPASWGISFE